MNVSEVLLQYENQARQTLLNQALFHLIVQNKGEITFPLSILSAEDMGGVLVEFNPEAKTITLKSVNCEQAKAYKQSLGEDKH